MKITIREVAAAAKVSLGTASRVLNGETNVNPEHVRRVTEAAKQLNYRRLRVRNRPAVGGDLAGRTIGLVMLGMSRSLVSLPVIAEAVHGAERALSTASAMVALIDVPDLENPPPSLANAKFDGVLLKGALQGDEIARCQNRVTQRLFALPGVWLLGRPDGCSGDCVGANDLRIGQLAADHLLERGHRHVGFINPKADHVLFTTRQVAFEARIRRAGGTVVSAIGEGRDRWLLPLRPAEEVGPMLELVDRLLALPEPPTALFCPADSIAAALYRSLAIRGVRVGRDLSVISVNNEQSLINILHPKLTTIDIHATQIGQRAVEQLAWRLANPLANQSIDVSLDPVLVPGDSVSDWTPTRGKAVAKGAAAG